MLKGLSIVTEPYAKEGEAVTCMNGHVIGIFARDVYRDEIVSAAMFRNRHRGVDWRPLAKLGNCPDCDAPWNGNGAPDGHNGILHFRDGWRR